MRHKAHLKELAFPAWPLNSCRESLSLPGWLQVEESLDFMAELPNLRIMMMGKQVGSWSPSSFHFISHLTRSLAVRHPGRDILLISFPGHQTRALPDDAYVSLM